MARLNFEQARNNLAIVEEAKNSKRTEIKNLYKSLTKNQEILDFLMIQIGKDIEQRFPGVKFRLISRIKTEKSLSDKVENDLAGLTDKKKISELEIYDIIALSIIIEKVPDEIKTGDASFDDRISELIHIRNDSKINIKIHEEQYEGYKNRIEALKTSRKEKILHKKENDKKIEEVSQDPEDKYGIKEYLEKISESLDSAVRDIGEQVKNMEKDMNNMKTIIDRTRDRYDKENNECNHTLADFIIKNLSKFDNVKTLGLSDIAKRFKQKENYDGYRAVHNCYQMKVSFKNEKDKEEEINFRCEIQGKSIDAFYVADKGKAARYHTNQKEEPGKIVKRKKLPQSLNFKTKKEIEEFREEVEKTVPQYRIYRHVKKKAEVEDSNENHPDIYTLSQKECFILFYANQLFGNDTLGIPANPQILDDIVNSSKLSEKGLKYKDYAYEDVEER